MPIDKAYTESILIIDDNPTNLGVLFTYFDELGFTVYVAEDGISAIEQAQLTIPDIILLDVLMPGIDGFETCQRLKDNLKLREIPVIFMTALSDVTNKIKGFEIGGVDYITKPIQQAELLARVDTHLTLRKLRRDLEKQNQTLQTRNAELDAYSRTVSHSLKNSIGTILGYGEILHEDKSMSDKARDRLSLIIQSANDLNKLTDEMLLLARINTQDVDIAPLNMADIVDASQKRLELLIKETQAEIITPDAWPIAMGHAPWIEEVWVNYLSNALKYGGNPPHITIGATPMADLQIQFWIKDKGRGLSENEQTNLFTEFTRLRTSVKQGHGLGLSIVKHIIHKLGGQVGVESESEQGSTFYFTLPSARP